jgi:hypothetical protein
LEKIAVKRYRRGARFVMDPRQHCRPLDRNERARILALSEALERRTRPAGARNGVVSQPGLRVLRALLLCFLRGSDGLCCPSYVVLMAATWLCKQSIANALKRLEACGILRITRRLVREAVDAGGFMMTVCRQGSNLYAIFEPGEHAGRLPVRQPAPRQFPKGAYAALANLLGWEKPRRGLPREQLQHSLMRGGVLPDGFQYPGNAGIAL